MPASVGWTPPAPPPPWPPPPLPPAARSIDASWPPPPSGRGVPPPLPHPNVARQKTPSPTIVVRNMRTEESAAGDAPRLKNARSVVGDQAHRELALEIGVAGLAEVRPDDERLAANHRILRAGGDRQVERGAVAAAGGVRLERRGRGRPLDDVVVVVSVDGPGAADRRDAGEVEVDGAAGLELNVETLRRHRPIFVRIRDRSEPREAVEVRGGRDDGDAGIVEPLRRSVGPGPLHHVRRAGRDDVGVVV